MDARLQEQYIRTSFEDIQHLLDNPKINEIMLNPYNENKGVFWIINTEGEHEIAKGVDGNPIYWDDIKTAQVISTLSGQNHKLTHSQRPILECNIPVLNFRFTGTLRPCALGANHFTIRKFLPKRLTFDDYTNAGLTENIIKTLRLWIEHRFNVVICGEMMSGKTTFGNAWLQEIQLYKPNERIIILQDTPELSWTHGSNIAPMVTTNEITMDDLVKLSLRYTGKRICVSEVRAAEAYSLYKAWQTGHRGGFTTMHAPDIPTALDRFEKMCMEHYQCAKVDRSSLASAINAVVSIQSVEVPKIDPDTGERIWEIQRRVTQIAEVTGYDSEHARYTYHPILGAVL
ncbi:MAG: ATPase, T2SS/T4P/T4SS family [Neisseriaceae bacterium]